jgi:hypothetical protein
VIGADGPSSLVVRAVYPDYTKQIPWFFVGQKFHEIIDCPLSPEYFHFWFHPGWAITPGAMPATGGRSSASASSAATISRRSTRWSRLTCATSTACS